jgi:ABC-type sugar transport system ATPase subunit
MYTATKVVKRYGGVEALRGVDIAIRAGEVHALLGANGAGKSTLVKILVGAEEPTSGTLELGGEIVEFKSVTDAASAGVASVFQELSLLPDLDVLTNMFLLREPRRLALVSRREMEARSRRVLSQIGLDVPLNVPCGQLSLGEQQLVEIAKSLLLEPRILLLDEPTSALQARETDRLMDVIRRLRGDGVAIVYVSHFLDEVLGIADVVTVLRDGATVMDGAPRQDVTVKALVTAMLGEQLASRRPTQELDLASSDSAPPPSTVGGLRITGLSVAGALSGVDLRAAPGEIVGLAGLEGAGQAAVLEVLFGQRRPASGHIRLPGDLAAPRNPTDAVRKGVALIPADRKASGGLLGKTIWENVSLVSAGPLRRMGFLLRRGEMRDRAATRSSELSVRAHSIDARLDELSGGNQQKVVFAKWLEAEPRLVLMDDPTRGVDVGAKAEMYEIIRELAREDRVLLLCSSELQELTELCDRVIVFWQGRAVAELAGPALSEHAVLHAINTGAVDSDQPTLTSA